MKNKQLLYLISSDFISSVGSSIQAAALAIYILDMTKSSQLFSLMLASAILPRVIFGPFFGVLTDWFNKKKILLLLNVLNFSVICLGLLAACYSPASAGTIKLIASGEQELSQAYTVMSFTDSIQAVVAPLIGASVYSLMGIKTVLLCNGLSFILSNILIYLLKNDYFKQVSQTKTLKQFGSDFVKGFQYMKGNQLLWHTAICVMILNFFSIPLFSVGNGVVAKLIFKVSNTQFSLIESVGIVAAFFSPFIFSLIKAKFSLARLFILSMQILASLVLILGIISGLNGYDYRYALYLGFIFCVSFVEGILNIAIMTLLQTKIEAQFSGRVNGILTTMFIGLVPVGQVIYGYLFTVLPVQVPFVITSLVYVGVIYLYKKGLKAVSN
ncbi:MAG: MFS transporter [Lactococcus sp.]|nr:MFS transporter [Lactococcus sp.]MDN5408807.1 MFS transporter [Lactococcus sp.]MDN5412819.1 MFS transporter [Lactococcus sp.]MDN5435335.1 MFS transporter [Lactococcus sp.]MDN5462718.1 MFS transporter [Lactococcus sp.]MDN5467124.1 MFS transporter [Lactococcus sp.]